MNKLTLGTAQLGMDYGINNKIGAPEVSDSFSILDYAYNQEIKSFDTALSYGSSENVLGAWVNKKKPKDIVITSKIPSLRKKGISNLQLEDEIRNTLKVTLSNLGIEKLDYYLIHDFQDMKYYGENIFSILSQLKNEGLIGNYGCSIYDLEELKFISRYKIGALQIPGSIFNQTILESNILRKIKKNGTKVFVRSAFVQGLIFMKDKEVPESLDEIKAYLQKLRRMTHEKNITIAEASVNYVRNHPNTDSVIFGVESIDQMKEIASIKEEKELNRLDINKLFSEIPLELIDPRYWR